MVHNTVPPPPPQTYQINLNKDISLISSVQVGVLLYTLATKLPPSIRPSLRALLAKWVTDKKLKTVPQLNAALDYIIQKSTDNKHEQHDIDVLALEAHCGVGVVVSMDTITMVVKV
jgi:hypothetical protein